MNWKLFAMRLVLAFGLVVSINLLPAATGPTRNAVEQGPAGSDFGLPLQVRIRDIMSTWLTSQALAAPHPPKPTTSNGSDAKLKAALQNRLLVPNLADLSIGPPSPAPLPGI